MVVVELFSEEGLAAADVEDIVLDLDECLEEVVE